MKRIDLIKKTISETLLDEIADIKLEGLVVDVRLTDGREYSVLIVERPIEQKDEPLLSLSGGCYSKDYLYLAHIFGKNKACAILAYDMPDFTSYDEWGDEIRTYYNPLIDYADEK